MKHLFALVPLVPATAHAHGAHAPVSDPMHPMAHVFPALLLAALCVVLVLLWRSRDGHEEPTDDDTATRPRGSVAPSPRA